MKTFKIFSTAALALMMAACSSEDTALNNSPAQQQGRKVHFTATIAAPGGNAGTRTEYTEVTEGDAAGTINVAWKAKDEIALIHNGTKDVVTVETVNEDGSATITGDITVGTNGEAVTAYYPAAAIELNSDKNPVPVEAYTEKMRAQDGTLSYIASNLDLRSGKSTIAVDGDKATLSDNVKLASQIAIWKLSLQDGESNVLKATQVKIKGGESVLASTATIAATSEVTLAIPTDVAIDGALTIEATVGDDTYAYTKAEGVTFNPGTYYQSKVTMAKIVDLSTVTTATTIEDGYTVTGTLGANVKISIADGATVTLDGVTINGENNESYNWAGLTCLGDATIILKDGTENTVNGFHQNYPGIYVPGDAENPANNKTLTIKGTGSLTAICQAENGWAAGIGGTIEKDCGNIVIAGGTINATGGAGAGIGSGPRKSCGAITISGGTVTAKSLGVGAGIGTSDHGTCGAITISGGSVTATGGADAAGIGSCRGDGNQSTTGKCGDILISGGTVSATGGAYAAGIGSGTGGNCGTVTISGGTVTATGGQWAAGIGSGNEGNCGAITITTGVTQVTATKDGGIDVIGRGGNGYCGTVTIGGTVYWDGSNYQNGGEPYLQKSTIFYPVPDPIALSEVTSSQLGWIVGNDGKAYAVEPLPAGVDAVAKIFYVGSSTGVEGYTHGLALALTDESSTMSWTDATGDSGAAAHTPAAPTTTSSWMLPSYDQWDKMITAAGGYEALRDGFSGIAGASNLQSGGYWSSTENGSNRAYYYDFNRASRVSGTKSSDYIYVRACLAF